MKTQQLIYLLTTAEAGSISEAAKRLYVAPSSISAGIKEVEREYNFRIFERTSKGVTLTRKGQELLIDLQRITQTLEYVEEKYKNSHSNDHYFSVSTQHHICGDGAFLELYALVRESGFRLAYLECKTAEVLENVESGISDLGIIFYNLDMKSQMIQELRNKGLIYNHIAYLQPHIYLHRAHPLAAQSQLNNEDLQSYPFISYDTALGSGPNFTGMLVHAHSMRQKFYVTDRASAYMLMRYAQAFVVGTGYETCDEQNRDIVTRPLTDANQIEVGWVVKSNTALSELALRYAETLQILYK